MRLNLRSNLSFITLIVMLLSCSLLLTSCGAVTAQKISSSDFNSRSGGFPGMNGGNNFNGGGQGMDRGSTRRNSSQGTEGRAGSRP
ncbi:hypothetical protein [Paenibacillus sp. MMS20-IR301]|uniref:hypothetical protein n=1 Tax=Paenibacillus sp. MMS20-IR301 TaxID=2895946 RepID=UPI0028EE79C4|nr:hypothetical protein [Paenibacillus sp. MMS20-IR301]WNS41467.1 hypothetical protein LOS79_20900 [Paenibacillus sp. MMS20-IR301]